MTTNVITKGQGERRGVRIWSTVAVLVFLSSFVGVVRAQILPSVTVTPVSLAVAGGTVDGRTEDISEGGLLVITRQACEANQRAKVRFASPIEGRVVTCDAHVRWVRAAPPEVANGARAIGLEFIDPSVEICASIARYVAAMGEATGS